MLTEIVSATIPAKFDDNVTVDVIDGDGASSIIEVAREHRASLIVVGRRGRGGFKRLLLGSVSDEVATYAPCPVVITGKQQAWEPQSTIVVGVDGSPDSDRALAWAAHQAGARRLAIARGPCVGATVCRTGQLGRNDAIPRG